MRGFSLLEGLIAMFIVTVVFFAVVAMYPSSVMASMQAGERMTASHVAGKVLEDARLQSFDAYAPGEHDLADQKVGDTIYHVHLTVTAPAADVRELRTQVSWRGRTAESVSYQTAIFNYEGGQP